MADGKWISGLRADLPVAAAAERALKVRLSAVRSRLPLAAERAHEDIEHVHQLRVATRRARAAIDLFRSCLPTKFYTRVRRTLRRLRRAAGAARDCDVLLLRWQSELKMARPRLAAGLHWVSGQVCARRTTAQAELQAIATSERKQLQRLLRNVPRQAFNHATHPGPADVLGGRAIPALDALLTELETVARADLRDYAMLHQVRIAGKRLRYALEIFIPVCPAEFKLELYPRVEAMQELLGEVNDHAVAIETLEGLRAEGERFQPTLWPVWRPGLAHLLRRERSWLSAAKRRFFSFWLDWQRDDVFGRFRATAELHGADSRPVP